MKRILSITALFLLAASVYAQPNNPSVRNVGSDPTGNACTSGAPILWDTANGKYYGCNGSSVYALLGGGSGSGTVSDGAGTTTANQLAVSTGTAHTQAYVAPSALPQTVAWEKKGTVISGGSTAASVAEELTHFPVASASILTNLPTGAQVIGGVFTLGWSPTSLEYVESLDDQHWTGSADTLSGYAHSCEATISGTYYILADKIGATPQQIDIYSFAAGTFTLVKAAIVTASGVGWKQSGLGNCGFVHALDGTYRLFYDGQKSDSTYSIGEATCTAPGGAMTCTDYVSNPIMTAATSGGTITDPKSVMQLGATSWVMWPQETPSGVTGVLPTDTYFSTAASPTGPWTTSTNAVFYRTELIEGVNSAYGQVADFDPIDFNGGCDATYTQFPNGNNGLSGGNGLARANIPCEQLLNVTQSVATPASGIGLSSYGTSLRTTLASPIGASNNAAFSVITLTLLPGTYLLSGNLQWVTNGSTSMLFSTACISTTTASCAPATIEGTNSLLFGTSGTTNPSGYAWNNGVGNVVVTVPIGSTSGVTYYLVGDVGFGSGAVNANAAVLNATRLY